jgi:probable rRNA maturation factor
MRHSATGGNPCRIIVRNLQRAVRLNLASFQQFSERALRECERIRRNQVTPLTTLGEISVFLISDRRMATLHQQFLHVAGPTDVLTFQHGEIFISVDTARRHARRFSTTLIREVRLYIVHALLHLHGFDDGTAFDARKMAGHQERILDLIEGTRATRLARSKKLSERRRRRPV